MSNNNDDTREFNLFDDPGLDRYAEEILAAAHEHQANQKMNPENHRRFHDLCKVATEFAKVLQPNEEPTIRYTHIGNMLGTWLCHFDDLELKNPYEVRNFMTILSLASSVLICEGYEGGVTLSLNVSNLTEDKEDEQN